MDTCRKHKQREKMHETLVHHKRETLVEHKVQSGVFGRELEALIGVGEGCGGGAEGGDEEGAEGFGGLS